MNLREYATPEPVSPECIRDEQWLQRNLSDLVSQHPDKWIAVIDEQLVAVGDDLGDVTRRVEQTHPGSEPLFHLVEGTVRVYLPHRA